MADFRKWLMAFAVITLLLGFGSTAVAQIPNTASVTCTANNAAPRQVRVEGVAELVGDIVLNCTGGTQTTAGQAVPLANIQVALSAPITSRVFSLTTGVGEPILTIDDPYPATKPFPIGIPVQAGYPVGQIGCLATGGQTVANPFLTGTVGVCDIHGVTSPGETYQSQYNTFQGAVVVSSGIEYISFIGVPIDPPGSNYERILRITNVRADATHVPVGQTITASVSVSFINSITLSSPYTTVAFVFQGLVQGTVAKQNEVNCNWPGTTDAVGITFSEGPVFASSFKTGLITALDAKAGGGLNSLRTDQANAGWQPQDLLGTAVNYYTESGFTPQLTAVSGTADPLAALVNQSNAPAYGDGTIGVADYGTRFRILINNLQNGILLTFPVTVNNPLGTSPNLTLQLIKNPNADGTGGTWATAKYVSAGTWTPTSGNTSDFVVYEVVQDDPNLVESATVVAKVTYDPSIAINLKGNIPALGLNSTTSTSTMTVSFAPIAADTPGLPLLQPVSINTATKYGSLPRFIVTQNPLPAVILNPCSCNLLYPWIVSGSGFDTGMVVVNTSVSPTPWGVTDQSGVVTLWFTGTRAGATVYDEFHPNAAKSEPPIQVPAGCSFSLIMSAGSSVNCLPVISGNGSISTSVTTGFVGYIIATTTFQYCHGVAYVSPISNPLQGAYYEALELDYPLLYRTGQIGENVGH